MKKILLAAPLMVGLSFNHGYAKILLSNQTDENVTVMFLNTATGKSQTKPIKMHEMMDIGNETINFFSVLPLKIKGQVTPTDAWSIETIGTDESDTYKVTIGTENNKFNIKITEEWEVEGKDEKVEAKLIISKELQQKSQEQDELKQKLLKLGNQLNELQKNPEKNTTEIQKKNDEIQALSEEIRKKAADEAAKKTTEEKVDPFAEIEDLK